MKRVKLYYSALLALLVLLSCGEEHKNAPLFTDATPPPPVSNVVVTNTAGGATLEYTVPDVDDLLLVEVNYERNDEKVNDRSSVFSNKVEIRGLSSTEPQQVTLVAIDRSDNRSEAVTVTINPLKAPINRFFDSFELVPDFGGVRLNFENQENLIAEVLFYTKDDSGAWVYDQSAFLNEDDNESVKFTFRDFPDTEAEFSVIAVDRWNNVTTRKTSNVTPLKEVQLDRENFGEIFLNGDAPAEFGTRIARSFDGEYNRWPSMYHSGATFTPNAPIIAPYTEGFHMITFDLGTMAKLSRFKWWLRTDCCGTPYGHGDPKRFEMWGINELPADNGDSLEGWVKLVENGEVVKPSGLPLGQHSAEDDQKALDGEEFEFDLNAPPVRYIRFVNLENHTGGKWFHVTEFEFYGVPQ